MRGRIFFGNPPAGIPVSKSVAGGFEARTGVSRTKAAGYGSGLGLSRATTTGFESRAAGVAVSQTAVTGIEAKVSAARAVVADVESKIPVSKAVTGDLESRFKLAATQATDIEALGRVVGMGGRKTALYDAGFLHGSVYEPGRKRIYGCTFDYPPQVVRFNPDTLASDVITLSGPAYYSMDITYVPSKDKLYVATYDPDGVTNNLVVHEIDPDTLSDTVVVSDSLYFSPWWLTTFGSQSITSDGTSLFIAGASDGTAVVGGGSLVVQYALSDWSRTAVVATSYKGAHCVRYDPVSGKIFLTGQATGSNGSVTWIARFTPSPLAQEDVHSVGSHTRPVCDDFVFVDNYVWCPIEEQANANNLVKVQKDSLATQVEVDTGVPFAAEGVCFDGTYLWLVVSPGNMSAPGFVVRVDPATGAAVSHPLFAGEYEPDEIVTDGARIFYTSLNEAGIHKGRITRVETPWQDGVRTSAEAGKAIAASVVTGYESTAVAALGAMEGGAFGLGSAVGTLTGAGALVGSAAGLSGVAATLTGAGALAGTAAGVSTATGVLGGAGALAGGGAGVSTASGLLTAVGALAGGAAGVATATGVLAGTGSLAGGAAGISSATGTLTGDGALAGSAAGVSSTYGSLTDLTIAGNLNASVFGISSVAGTLTGAGVLAGGGAGVSTGTGTLGGSGALAGSAAGVSSVAAALGGSGALSGVAAGVSAARGALLGAGALAGGGAGISAAIGTLAGAGALAGRAAGLSALAGGLTGTGALAGGAVGLASVSGLLAGSGALAGGAFGISAVHGTLSSLAGAMLGGAAGLSAAYGTLTGAGALVGSAAGISSVYGTLLGTGALAGRAAGISAAWGRLVSIIPTPPDIIFVLGPRRRLFFAWAKQRLFLALGVPRVSVLRAIPRLSVLGQRKHVIILRRHTAMALPDSFPKHPAENIDIGVDFTAKLAAGTTIVSATATVVGTGTITVGTPSVASPIASALVSGGTDGKTDSVLFLATTNTTPPEVLAGLVDVVVNARDF